jgi:N-methylhydantoinase A
VSASWYVGVDIGGTFTDVVAVDAESGALHHLKVPSSRSDPAAGFVAGLTALRDEVGVRQTDLRLLLHGTTLATNAIIERRLASTALVTTQGFRDVLEIGRHWRDELYDPFLEYPGPLVSRELRFEVDERIDAAGDVVVAVDRSSANRVVEHLEAANVEAVAVVFLHSYRNPAHEEEVTALLRETNGWFVCGSAELSRELREYERTSTTVMNAALMPLIDTYLTRLETALAAAGSTASLFVTQSNGGALTPAAARARPVTLALSGPVAGVVACGQIGRTIDRGDLICFDMGGTSADVSIISDFEPRMSSELKIGDLPMRLPAVHVHSIGAGGGSLASIDVGGSLRVGPESAGSEPGPACYGRGGTAPTVTDCQLILGRLTDAFPLAGRLGLDAALANQAIQPLAETLDLNNESAAAGVIEVVNAAMEGAVRVALRSRGDDPRNFALVAFGGAGPLHAAELARRLAIDTVVVPPHPGTLSALGLLTADVRLDFAMSELHSNSERSLAETLLARFGDLAEQARDEVESDAQLRARPYTTTYSCDVRYRGQAYEVSVPVELGALADGRVDALFDRFHELHLRSYGFSSPADECEVVTMRVVATIGIDKPSLDHVPEAVATGAKTTRSVFMPDQGVVEAVIYERNDLAPGRSFRGPAVIHQADSTTLVPGYAEATIDRFHNLVLTIDGAAA